MRGMSFLLVQLAVLGSFVGCQSSPPAQDPAISELEERVASLSSALESYSARHGEATAELERLEAEKATRTELAEATSRPWRIGVPLGTAHLLNGAVRTVDGIELPEVEFTPLIAFEFGLPEDYVQGSDIEVRVAWKNRWVSGTPPCAYSLLLIDALASVDGLRQFNLETAFRGFDGVLPAPSDDVVQSLSIDIHGSATAGALRAGDHVRAVFYRDPSYPQDTCSGSDAKMIVVGLSVHPAG